MSQPKTTPYELMAEQITKEFLERRAERSENDMTTGLRLLPGMLHELIHDTLEEGMLLGGLHVTDEVMGPAELLEAYNAGIMEGKKEQ